MYDKYWRAEHEVDWFVVCVERGLSSGQACRLKNFLMAYKALSSVDYIYST